jgi:formylglycine-generating enzyme required for sulfatase activity
MAASRQPLRQALRIILASVIPLLGVISDVARAELTVSNIRPSQRAGTKLVDIDYDLSATEPFAFVTLEISNDGGTTFTVPALSVTGAIGGAVRPGLNKRMTWNAGADWNGQVSPQMRFRLATETAPPGMAIIPAGTFQMGDPYTQGQIYELPVHQVYTSRFLISRFEITHEQMREALQWAYDQQLITVDATTVRNIEGSPQPFLSFTASDGGRQATFLRFANGFFYVEADKGNFPMGGVTWYGALAYCNYRSNMEGLQRCIDFSNWTCDFTKNGYRLPTEAEWEKAARGGLTGHHFSWPSFGGNFAQHIDGYMAKYNASRDPWYYTALYWTTPVGYFNGSQLNYGQPAGTDMVNGYGLYDMIGNVWEWCWDNWKGDWYSQPGAIQADSTGPLAAGAVTKVIRGGSFGYNASSMRVAYRHTRGFSPTYLNFPLGLRPVRRE